MVWIESIGDLGWKRVDLAYILHRDDTEKNTRRNEEIDDEVFTFMFEFGRCE